MEFEKNLVRINVFPKEKLNIEEKLYISRTVAEMIADNIHELNEDYNEISMRLMNCDMYYADIDPKYGNVIYYYKNNSIYIQQLPLEKIPKDQIIRECLHYLQNFSQAMKSNKKVGLSNFDGYRIVGLGLNEAIIQYMTAMATGQEFKRIKISDVSVYTNSGDYYQLLTSLAHQMVLLMGSKTVIGSAINCNIDFEDDIYNTFEENTNKIFKNFDLLLEENNKDVKNEDKMIDIYMQTQELIYKTYFYKIYKFLTLRIEVDKVVQKMCDYELIVGKVIEEQKSSRLKYNKNFDSFIKEMDKKFYRKYIEIDEKIARNLPKRVQNNLWTRIMNKIRTYLQYKERKI